MLAPGLHIVKRGIRSEMDFSFYISYLKIKFRLSSVEIAHLENSTYSPFYFHIITTDYAVDIDIV